MKLKQSDNKTERLWRRYKRTRERLTNLDKLRKRLVEDLTAQFGTVRRLQLPSGSVLKRQFVRVPEHEVDEFTYWRIDELSGKRETVR